MVRAELATSMPECTVASHDDYDGNMMIVVFSTGGAADSTSYILQASRSGFELSVATEDRLETWGIFPSLGEATARLDQIVSISRHSKYVRVA
jgi:hypothetical protein